MVSSEKKEYNVRFCLLSVLFWDAFNPNAYCLLVLIVFRNTIIIQLHVETQEIHKSRQETRSRDVRDTRQENTTIKTHKTHKDNANIYLVCVLYCPWFVLYSYLSSLLSLFALPFVFSFPLGSLYLPFILYLLLCIFRLWLLLSLSIRQNELCVEPILCLWYFEPIPLSLVFVFIDSSK